MNGRSGLWLHGALYLELRRGRYEDVPRLLSQQGVFLYDVQMGASTCRLCISLRDFPKVYRVCRAHGVKIRFLRRFGVPFAGRALARRKSLAVGAILFAALVYGAASMVWQVRVTGTDAAQTESVLAAASSLGLHPGAWKRSLPDVNQLQRDLLSKLPDVIWVGVRVVGTKAQVDVVEKIPGVSKSTQTPHNIVVRKPGVIRAIIATRGEVLLKPGQTVQPGQLAISGDLGGGAKQVPAQGEVLAEVWYKSTVQLPLTVRPSGLTGASVQRDYLAVGNTSLRTWGWSQPNYKHVVERERSTQWHIGPWRLPIAWQQVTLEQVQPQVWVRTVDNGEQTALDMARQDVLRQIGTGGVILGQTVLHRELARGKLYETVMTRTEEDIGAPAPIPPKQPDERVD